jgi:hypothetical protein
MTIALDILLDKLPIEQIQQTIHEHLHPLTEHFPDQRLKKVAEEMVLRILGSESPLITQMARQNDRRDGEVRSTAKRSYRFLEKARLATAELYEGLYQVGCQAVTREAPNYLGVADDPHFEAPLVLLTNVALLQVAKVESVYTDWRLRGRIEHGYRFDQAQGLDDEDTRAHTLERTPAQYRRCWVRCLFALVLLAAQIVFVIDVQWPTDAVR